MARFMEVANLNRKQAIGAATTAGVFLLLMIAVPNILRPRMAEYVPFAIAQQHAQSQELAARADVGVIKAKPAAAIPAGADASVGQAPDALAVATARKIVRTGALALVVQRPDEVAQSIRRMAQGLGGYLTYEEGGGQAGAPASLTMCVPAARFEEARAEVRKLALRVETEKVDAKDVTRQYVDEDASLRNLRAEEAQYLAIMKQAHTVKDMLAVSEKVSEVRGQIEQQEAEFNALSKQIETASIAISLRSEADVRVLGFNWRPGYQLKVALHDGLESVADYATAVLEILFYLPAVLLWVGTIFLAGVGGWKTAMWIGRKMGWVKSTAAANI